MLNKKKYLTILLIVAFSLLIFFTNFRHEFKYFTLEYLIENYDFLLNLNRSHQLSLVVIYFFVYILSTAFSLPGATVLTLAGGAILGFIPGLLVVSFASTIGAILAFLISRYLLRNYIQNKFKDKLEKINNGVKNEGVWYLFSLRLVPVFPFF